MAKKKTSKASTTKQSKTGSKTRTNAKTEPTTEEVNASALAQSEDDPTPLTGTNDDAIEDVNDESEVDESEVEETEDDREQREREEAEAREVARAEAKARAIEHTKQWVNRRVRDAITVNVASRVSVGYICRTWGLDGNEAQELISEVLDPMILDLDEDYELIGGELSQAQKEKLAASR